MTMFFDRSRNAYQIDDEKQVKRKTKITLTNSAGEEFEVDASKADEFRLTPDEHRRVFEDVQNQAAILGRALGHCPVIDPVRSFSGLDRDLVTTLTRIMEGCPNIDPMRIGSVLGTLVQRELGAQRPEASCPNIDPMDIDTVVGTRPIRGGLDVANMLRNLLDSCPNIDPIRIGSIMGSLVERELFGRGRR